MIRYNYIIHYDNGEEAQLNNCRYQIKWQQMTSNSIFRVVLDDKAILLNMAHIVSIEESAYDDDPTSAYNISQAMRRFNGNTMQAAESLGISTRTLYRKAKEHGLDIGNKDGLWKME